MAIRHRKTAIFICQYGRKFILFSCKIADKIYKKTLVISDPISQTLHPEVEIVTNI